MEKLYPAGAVTVVTRPTASTWSITSPMLSEAHSPPSASAVNTASRSMPESGSNVSVEFVFVHNNLPEAVGVMENALRTDAVSIAFEN